MMENILSIRELSMSYRVGKKAIRALDKVSLDFRTGSSTGIVGESGCGKSTLALAIMKLLPQNAVIENGELFLHGEDLLTADDKKVRDIRWNKVSIIFQGAMNALNPVVRIGAQIKEPLMKHSCRKMSSLKMDEKVIDLVKSVNLVPEVLSRYPHELSGGMKQRVMVAMSLVCSPEIIIADEPTTALDVIAQDRVLELIESLQRKLNLTLLLISHDISLVAETCEFIVIMYAGCVVESGSTRKIFENPLHPYTKALLSSVPSIRGKKSELMGIRGELPDMSSQITGCKFAERCPECSEICKSVAPPYLGIGDEHMVRCHLMAECGLVEDHPPVSEGKVTI